MYYLPNHPSVTVVIDHSVVKIKHHQSLHFLTWKKTVSSKEQRTAIRGPEREK